MIWPFRELMTDPEPRPHKREKTGGILPLCGNHKEHDFWENDGWPCPGCAAIEDRRRALVAAQAQRKAESERDARLADMVSERVVQRLREAGLL